MITVEENLQRIDHQQQQLATGLMAMHHDLLAEITRLQGQITHLEAHPPKNLYRGGRGDVNIDGLWGSPPKSWTPVFCNVHQCLSVMIMTRF